MRSKGIGSILLALRVSARSSMNSSSISYRRGLQIIFSIWLSRRQARTLLLPTPSFLQSFSLGWTTLRLSLPLLSSLRAGRSSLPKPTLLRIIAFLCAKRTKRSRLSLHTLSKVRQSLKRMINLKVKSSKAIVITH